MNDLRWLPVCIFAGLCFALGCGADGRFDEASGAVTEQKKFPPHDAGRPRLDAALDAHSFPATMAPSETVTATLTMRNTGKKAWRLRDDFVLFSLNSPAGLWGPTQVPVSSRTRTGSSATFAFQVTAPRATGGYFQRWQMAEVRGTTVLLFGDVVEVPVIVEDETEEAFDAKVIRQSVPDRMTAGTSYLFSITMQNSGTAPWSGDRFKLSSRNTPPDLWGPTEVALGTAETVAPGDTRQFDIGVTAPADAGTFTSSWQMQQADGAGFFGQDATYTGREVTFCGNGIVEPGEECDGGDLGGATCGSASGGVYPLGPLGCSWECSFDTSGCRGGDRGCLVEGATYEVPYDATTCKTGYDYCSWDCVSVQGMLGVTVQSDAFVVAGDGPVSSETIPILVNTPVSLSGSKTGSGCSAGPDSYFFSVSVDCATSIASVNGGCSGSWPDPCGFLEDYSMTFHRTPDFSAVIARQVVPPQVVAGRPHTFSITVRNTGLLPWTAADVALRSDNTPVDLWGTTAVPLGATDVVSPGEEYTFSFSVTAPTIAGKYYSQWRLSKGAQLFGSTASKYPVHVTLCGNGVREADERCDGADLGTETCAAQTHGLNPLGQLSCSAACTFDTTGCSSSTPMCPILEGNAYAIPFTMTDCTLADTSSCSYDCMAPSTGTLRVETQSPYVLLDGLDWLQSGFRAGAMSTGPDAIDASFTFACPPPGNWTSGLLSMACGGVTSFLADCSYGSTPCGFERILRVTSP